MDAPSILFKTKGIEVELSGSALPTPPIQWGASHRTTVTRYSDNFTSVQSHGLELNTIEIDGTLRDSNLWEGGAQDIRGELENLMNSRRVVLFEYDSEQLWGIFEVGFLERHRGDLDYRIKFTPYWTSDPEQTASFVFLEPPTTIAAKIDALKNKVASVVSKPPEQAASERELAILSDSTFQAASRSAEFSGELVKLNNLATLSFTELRSVQEYAYKAKQAITLMLTLMKKMKFYAFMNNPVQMLRVNAWLWDLQRAVRSWRYETFVASERIESQIKPLTGQVYLVKEGDTLPRIANTTLGDFSRWDEIAEANEIRDGIVNTGQVIRIPR